MNTPHQHATDLLAFIDQSPSPWHAGASIQARLLAHQFEALDETATWSLTPGGRYFVLRDDSSIIAFTVGRDELPKTGFKMVGAHTDSPGLRVKPNALNTQAKMLRVGVEVYGGPILATFTDRDLSLAGRIAFQDRDSSIKRRLVRFDQSLLRLPNLAIHMNRTVNEEGLKLHKQNELPLIMATNLAQSWQDRDWQVMLAKQADIDPEQLLSFELNVYDTQPGTIWGKEQEFYSNSQLDNLASCHAAITALVSESALSSAQFLVCAFFDHEEIGSESQKGAAGSFLSDVLSRISFSCHYNHEDYLRALANSLMISSDMAHAFHPNFASAYEPDHQLWINQGPAIKCNANHRYASQCDSEARFVRICQQAEVPVQRYVHRTDLGCGSTIGPLCSARIGVATVDIGNPLWAMHSIRESAGVQDHDYLIRALNHFFSVA